MLLRNILKELLILVGVAVICALVFNALSPKGIALFGEWDTSKGVVSAKSKDDAVVHDMEIRDPRLAKVVFDNGAVFVDARSLADYAKGHIAGAIVLPAWDYESHMEAFRNMVPLDAVVVTYCTGRECDDSHVLAQELLMAGYNDVRVFIDGFPAWVEAGYPVE